MATITVAAAVTAAESRGVTGGMAIAAVVAVALAVAVLHGTRRSHAALGHACLAAVVSASCGGIVGWLATPYMPDGSLTDVAAALSGGGGMLTVVVGAYLWLPVASLAVVAWVACRRAAVRGRAGALGITAGLVAMSVSALALTVSGRPAAATTLVIVAGVAGAVAVAAEVSTRTRATQR